MPLTRSAEATAARAANNRGLEVLTRVGFVGYGIVHLLLAWLAAQIAFDRSTGDGDQSGALRTLAAQPLGRALVVAVAVGLLAMAIWQALEAAVGHRADRGAERALERVTSVGRTAVYGYFAWTAYLVFSEANSSTADKQQALTTHLMSAPGGRWLVALAGLALAGLGVGLIAYGLTGRFEKHLLTGRMSPAAHRLGRRLGRAGYAAKGISYGVAGVLILTAAVTYHPDQARGLDAALRALREQSYGQPLLAVIALGFAAFGLFCFVQARYRKV